LTSTRCNRGAAARRQRRDEVAPEQQAGVVRVVVVVDRLLVQVAVSVAEVGDRDGDDGGEEEAVAEAGAEDAEDADRQVGEPDLGLEAAVAVGVADTPISAIAAKKRKGTAAQLRRRPGSNRRLSRRS
jgi:hypothetical protein